MIRTMLWVFTIRIQRGHCWTILVKAVLSLKVKSRVVGKSLPLPEENSGQSIPTEHHGLSPSHLKDKIGVNQNFTKLFLPGLARCLISWFLIGAFYVSLWKYKDRVLSPRAKSQFDSITVALSIAFGLNIASALKAIALDLRWWVLSMRKRSSREVRCIFQLKERFEGSHSLLLIRLTLFCIATA